MGIPSLMFHFCDAFWEYRASTNTVFLHKDGVDPDLCGRWMSFDDASRRYAEMHVDELDKDIWQKYLSPEAMQAFAHGDRRDESFYLRVGNGRNEQEWHEVHLQRAGDDLVYLASKDIQEMRRSSAIAKAMVPEFDYVGCIDPADGSYVLYYSDARKPAVPQSAAMNYEEALEMNTAAHVIPQERETILQSMSLSNVVAELEKMDDYVVFCTMQEQDGVSYKRMRFSYEDERKERILLTLVDMGALMGERKLREQEKAKRVEYLDNMPVAFHSVEIVLDDDGAPVDFKFTYCNRAYAEMEGVEPSDLIGKNYYDLYDGDERMWLEYYYDTAYTGTPHVISGYGPRLQRHLLVYTFRSEFGHCECALLDMTEQRRLIHELERSRETMRKILELTTERVFEYHPARDEIVLDGRDGHPSRVIPASGLDDPEAHEVHLREGCRGELSEAFKQIRDGAQSASVSVQARAEVNAPWTWMRLTMFEFQSGSDGDRTVLGFLQNIDEFRSREEALRRRAERDSLTGLLNVGAGRQRVNRQLRYHEDGSETCRAMLVMDLDNFKAVNDTLGHRAGDEVLIAFAEVLRNTFRAEDTVCRLGGDEFMVYIDSLTNPEADMRAISDRLLSHVEQARSKHPALGCSVGAFVTNGGYSFEGLYEMADRELYKAKRSGKGRYSIAYDIAGGDGN